MLFLESRGSYRWRFRSQLREIDMSDSRERQLENFVFLMFSNEIGDLCIRMYSEHEGEKTEVLQMLFSLAYYQ